MSCKVRAIVNNYQEFPTHGKLFENISLSLMNLVKQIDKPENSNSIVFAYTIDTVKYENDELHHTGCGPNFQGNLITLCTCKHQMRARSNDKKFWENNWVAGFCSKRGYENALFYLMKISNAFESHSDLWQYLDIMTRNAKSTHRSKFGDVYEPIGKLTNEKKYLRNYYKKPFRDNRHNDKENIVYDIERKFWGKQPYLRHPLLLAGYPEQSYIWKNPLIISSYRKQVKFRQIDFTFTEFLQQLIEK